MPPLTVDPVSFSGHPSQWGSASSSVDSSSLRGSHSLSHGNFSQLVSKPLSGVAASLPPHLSSSHLSAPVRVGTIGSHVGTNQIEAGHSLGHMGLGVHRLPPQHPHSLPEYSNGVMNSVNYSPAPGSVSAANSGTSLRSREVVEASRLQRTSSGTLTDLPTYDHANGGIVVTLLVIGLYHLLSSYRTCIQSAFANSECLGGLASVRGREARASCTLVT